VVAVAGSSSSGIYSSDGTVRMVGVSGILRKEQEMWESTDKSLQDAFQDLNALMVMSFCLILFYVLFFIVIFVYLV
jgi:ESCRT-II complex subunit VPS36